MVMIGNQGSPWSGSNALSPTVRSIRTTSRASSIIASLTFTGTDGIISPAYTYVYGRSTNGQITTIAGHIVTNWDPFSTKSGFAGSSSFPQMLFANLRAKYVRTGGGGRLAAAGLGALRLAGRGAARLLPVLGAGALAYDAYNLAKEVFSSKAQEGVQGRPGNSTVQKIAGEPWVYVADDTADLERPDIPAYGVAEQGGTPPDVSGDLAGLSNLPMTSSDRVAQLTPYMDALTAMINEAGLTPTDAYNSFYNDFTNSAVTNTTIRNNPIYQMIASALTGESPDCSCITYDQWSALFEPLSSGSNLIIPDGGLEVNMDKYLLLGGTGSDATLNVADIIPSYLRLDINNDSSWAAL